MDEDEAIQVLVLTAYGAFQTPEPTMAAYFNEAICWCNAKRPEIIVMTGGCSRMKTLPGRSEARSILDYIKPRLAYAPIMISDEKALTTLDNICNADTQLRLRGYNPREMRVAFWCDSSRKSTIELVGRPIFGNTLRVINGSVKVVEDALVTNLVAKVVTWLASKSPFINDHFREIRRRHFAGR